MFTYIHLTTRRYGYHSIYHASSASKVGKSGFYGFFFFLLSAGAYKICQTLIFHLEVLYATISLHTFLNKIKITPAYFQKYLAVGRRPIAYYLNIVIKQSFKRTVGCLLAFQLDIFA